MSAGLIDLLKAVVALFVIVDPFGNIPIFLSLTGGMDSRQRRRAFNRAIAVGFAVLTTVTILGERTLSMVGVTMYSFMIAGGILLQIVAIKILVHEGWGESDGSPEDLGAVPLAVPLLIGPGAITTSIMSLQSYGYPVALAAIGVVLMVVWVVLRFIDPINRVLGRTGANVVSKVMAIFIAAIGVQFIIRGLQMYLGAGCSPAS